MPSKSILKKPDTITKCWVCGEKIGYRRKPWIYSNIAITKKIYYFCKKDCRSVFIFALQKRKIKL